MPIDFHYFVCSPPCRSVILLAKAIGVHLNLKTTCPAKGDLTKSGFAKVRIVVRMIVIWGVAAVNDSGGRNGNFRYILQAKCLKSLDVAKILS